jgi:hypothetical protein
VTFTVGEQVRANRRPATILEIKHDVSFALIHTASAGPAYLVRFDDTGATAWVGPVAVWRRKATPTPRTPGSSWFALRHPWVAICFGVLAAAWFVVAAIGSAAVPAQNIAFGLGATVIAVWFWRPWRHR